MFKAPNIPKHAASLRFHSKRADSPFASGSLRSGPMTIHDLLNIPQLLVMGMARIPLSVKNCKNLYWKVKYFHSPGRSLASMLMEYAMKKRRILEEGNQRSSLHSEMAQGRFQPMVSWLCAQACP